MDFTKVFYFVLGFATCSFASQCQDLSGNWTNELGSRMVLEVDNDGRLRGAYQTAVESTPGAAAIVSNILGISSNRSSESHFAFSILFSRGLSVASWVGQCLVCNDEEMLYTTYILHSPRRKWPFVVTGQNTFRRQREGEVFDTMQPLIESKLVNANALEEQSVAGKWKSREEQIEFSVAPEAATVAGSNLQGIWRPPNNQEHIVLGLGDSSLKASNSLRHDVEDNGTIALAWMTLAEGRIRSWSGFVYHVPKSRANTTIDTAWLEHGYEPKCLNPGGIVKFGMTSYTKATIDQHHTVMKSETFLDKLRNFFTSLF